MAIKNSIVFRLSFTLVCLSALLLIALSAGTFYITSWQLDKDDHRFMTDVAGLLKARLSEEGDSITDGVQKHIQQEISAIHDNHYFLQLRTLDPTAAVLFQTAFFPAVTDWHTMPLTPVTALPQVYGVIKTPTGYYLRSRFIAPIGQHRLVEVRCALEVTPRIQFLGQLRNTLVLVVIMGSLLFLLASIWVAKTALKPVWQFSQHVHQVEIDSLNRRLSGLPWPVELQPLANSFDHLLSRLAVGIERLTHFSSDMAHEIKTPLTNLRVETEVLLAQPRTPAEYENALRDNLEEMERLSSLIERLLMLARLENSLQPGQAAWLPLPDAIAPLLEYFNMLIEEKGLHFNQTGQVSLFVDKLLFDLVLGNLISNAIKYTPAGGHITLAIAQQSEPEGKPFTCLTITDTGVGIAPHHLPHLFDRFYRVDSSRSREVPGYGLGLAIVKAAMDCMGGTVHVTSQLGQGTTVTLRFASKLTNQPV